MNICKQKEGELDLDMTVGKRKYSAWAWSLIETQSMNEAL